MNNDLISRAEAIDVIRSMTVSLGGKDIFPREAKKSVLGALDDLPAIDAEPVIWAPVPGFEGLYEISTLAQVRNSKGEILKQQIRREKYTCYKVVGLWKGGRYYKKGIHRLIAEAFIPNPGNLPVVNHKDEDGTNNLLSNIEWCDKSYNASYGSAPKKISKAFKGKPSEKRIPVQQMKGGVVIKVFTCAGDAEKETGISMANIRLVCRKRRKTAGGYEWAYCGAKQDLEVQDG